MFTFTKGQSAPRSASIAATPTKRIPKIVADSVRISLADAQAELARALVKGESISALREEVANHQAMLASIEGAASNPRTSQTIYAGQIAIGVRAADLALSK